MTLQEPVTLDALLTTANKYTAAKTLDHMKKRSEIDRSEHDALVNKLIEKVYGKNLTNRD